MARTSAGFPPLHHRRGEGDIPDTGRTTQSIGPSVRRVIILDEAARDLERARDFYDRIDHDLGNYFGDSILSDLENLALFHGIHPRHFGFHRMLGRTFPFGIYYEDTAQETYVVAILDLRQEPLWIREELSVR